MSLIKGIMIFAAGIGTGAGVTYYIMQKKIAQTKAIEQQKPDVYMKEDELYEYYIHGLQELGYGTVPMSSEEYDEYEECISKVNPVKDEDEEEIEEAPGPVEPNPNPYIITENEFGQEDDYETVTLSYYKKDGIMTDDDNEILDGWKSHICEFETSKDAIYVRNESEMTDYEILIYDGSYANLIMGEDDTEMGNMAD